jgi:hypothetical protein
MPWEAVYIKAKIYLHGTKEDMWDQGEELKLTKSQLQEFIYTGYEVGIDIEVDNTGQAWATHLQGVKLERKVKI